MEKEQIIKDLTSNDIITNTFALDCLLDYGKINLLKDNFFNELIESTKRQCDSNKVITVAPKDYIIGIFKASRQMAMLETKDLCDFIQSEIYITQKVEQEIEFGKDEEYSEENTSPDYEY